MAEENVLPIPNLALPQECFVLQQSSLSHLHDTARVALLRGIEADQMAPYYRLVVAANVLPLDQTLLEKLEKDNAAELERLDKVLKEAGETEGESDIADALRAKAIYLTRIGEKVQLFSFFIYLKTLPSILHCSLTVLRSGKGDRGSTACARKDRRSGFANRHRPHARPHRLLLWRQPAHLHQPDESGRVCREGRRLGSSQSPQSVSRPSPSLHPPIQTGKCAPYRRALNLYRHRAAVL